MTKTLFGTTPSGEKVHAYELVNKNGMSVKVIEYGASLVSIKVPNGSGGKEELNLGFDTLEEYLNDNASFGRTVGRYANRIVNATFELDGVTIKLDPNRPPNHLHGGTHGFGRVVWTSELTSNNTVTFKYFSRDGDQGYPGNLHISASYTLGDDNGLTLIYDATTDKTTPISITNHAYFNLAGAGSGNVYGHEAQILSNKTVVVDKDLLPNGEFQDVKGTIFDLTKPTNLGEIFKSHPDFFGFDVSYVVSDVVNNPLKLVAKVTEPKSGRALEVYTTQPDIHLYTGNFMQKWQLAGGKTTDKHGAFCLETQNFPDGPNHKNFPNPFLKPGEVYHHETIYKFIF
uniref:Aldose 1-epimerase n=1 Tax=Acrobeloides nanus TaxID=290746 RepID=A0A914E6S8_9BILA